MQRNLKKSFRVPFALYLSVFQSLLWLVLFPQSLDGFRSVAPFRAQGYSSYLMFFVPSALTMTMLSVAFQSGMGMVTDIERGMLDKLLINPIRRSSILLGKVLADAARMLLLGALVLTVAALMGASPRTGIPGACLMLAIATLFGLAWAGLSNIVALRTRSSELTLMIGALFTFPMLFLSTAVMPRALLPSWLQSASRFNPVTYLVEAVRSLMNFGYEGRPLREALAIIAVLGALMLAGATRTFRRATFE